MRDLVFRLSVHGFREVFKNAYRRASELVEHDDYDLIIRKRKSKRSTEQNRRYWMLVRDLEEMAWVEGRQFSKDAWHEYIKQEFVGWEDLPNGQRSGLSTASLTVEEFNGLMTKLEAWAASQGWPIGL